MPTKPPPIRYRMLRSTDSPYQSILAAKVMSCCMDVQPILRRFGTLRDVSQDVISQPPPSCANPPRTTRLKPATEPLNTKSTGRQYPKCPYQGGGEVRYLKIALGHAANTRNQRYNGAKGTKEAADKGARHPPLVKESVPARQHLRMF